MYPTPDKRLSKTCQVELIMPGSYDFGSAQFDDAVRAAGRKAFPEALASGLPVFYVDAAVSM